MPSVPQLKSGGGDIMDKDVLRAVFWRFQLFIIFGKGTNGTVSGMAFFFGFTSSTGKRVFEALVRQGSPLSGRLMDTPPGDVD